MFDDVMEKIINRQVQAVPAEIRYHNKNFKSAPHQFKLVKSANSQSRGVGTKLLTMTTVNRAAPSTKLLFNKSEYQSKTH
jgi:hypothetical protein